MGEQKRRKSGASFWIIILLMLFLLLLLKNCGGCKRNLPPSSPVLPQPKVTLPSLPAPTTFVLFPPVKKKEKIQKEIRKTPEIQPVAIPVESKPVKRLVPRKQKGICYVVWNKSYYGSQSSDNALEKLAATHAEWVGLHTTWYQQQYNSVDIHPTDKTPTDESLIHAIQTIHKLGLKVMLRPYIDLLNSPGGEWRGSIEFDSEDNWQAWFDSYTKFILHYAQMAQEQGVAILCVGIELTAAATLRPDLWREKVIKSVREVYSGPLTYAANWDDEYLDIKFWDALDYAGIDPYFPLVETDQPTFEQIMKGWEPYVTEIEKWQKSINKPVIFTEIGYHSATGAAKSPWEHIPGKNIDLQHQADCYEALFQTFWDKPWFYGMYWWEWGSSVKSGGPQNRGFTPQNKPSEKVLTEWYQEE